MLLSNWIDFEGYSMRIIEGSDQTKVANRVAFIEKTARVRIKPFTEVNDFLNWETVSKIGVCDLAKKLCDEKLYSLYSKVKDL